jgi:general bacterial porin, GBP family
MQKKIIALAIAGLASSGAFAQTNVTVYGIMDAYVSYNSGDTRAATTSMGVNTAGVPTLIAKPTTKFNDASGYAVGSGGLSGSRLGFKGTEDLGNGLKAGFVLEYAVQNDVNTGLGLDGSNNSTRQALLTLSGNFGTVAIGRAQTAGYDWDCTTAPLAGSGLDAKGKLGGFGLLACGASGRANNALAYMSPNFSGFTFAANYARVTENQNGQPWSAAAPGATAAASGSVAPTGINNDADAYLFQGSYNNGPIAVSLIYSNIDYNVKSLTAITYATKNVDEWGISGSYDFGMVKLYGAYQTADWTVKSTSRSRNANNDKWTLGAAIPVGAKGSVAIQYADANIDRCTGTIAAATTTTINQFTNKCDSDAWSLAYTYNMSKRTTLYAGYVSVSNNTNAQNNSAMTGNQWKTDVGGDADTFVAGMRHSF